MFIIFNRIILYYIIEACRLSVQLILDFHVFRASHSENHPKAVTLLLRCVEVLPQNGSTFEVFDR